MDTPPYPSPNPPYSLFILTELGRLVNDLEHSADKPPEVFSLGVAEVDGVVHGMASSLEELDLSAGIHGRRENHLLKKVPVHVMGARKGKKETSLFQKTEGLKIKVFVSPRSARKLAPLSCKRRGIQNDDIIRTRKFPHHLKGISPDQLPLHILEAVHQEMALRCGKGLLRRIDEGQLLCTAQGSMDRESATVGETIEHPLAS